MARNWRVLLLCLFCAGCASKTVKNPDPGLDETQAKSFLATIYVSEVSQFDAKKSYSQDLTSLNFTPDQGFALLDYWLGFAPQCGAKADLSSVLDLKTSSPPLRPSTMAAMEDIRSYLAKQKCPNTNEFRAYAIGSADGQRLEIWTIDQSKTIHHLPAVRIKQNLAPPTDNATR